MAFDFDAIISRENTNSVKFDGRALYFGTSDLTPLWVADMDFAIPDCITSALNERMKHPLLGYSMYPDSLYEAIIDWFSRRHGWAIERDWICMAPGVVPSLFAAVQACTLSGESVIVQPPVYFPFFSAVTTNHRKLLLNPLQETNGRYQIDVEHLEYCAQQGARLLLFCSPHNPVGRVWSETELQEVLRITRKYKMTIVSDDIHCDLVYSHASHTMLGRLANASDNIITTIAPNKTFNIPGLGLSALIIPQPSTRAAFKQVFDSLHVSNYNPLSMVAFEAAYRGGEQWLIELMQYLEATCEFVSSFLAKHVPQIKMIKPDATYLVWLDCRALGLSDAELKDFFVRECRLGLNPGVVFGEAGSGFMRLNIGTRLEVIRASLCELQAAVERRLLNSNKG